MSIDDTHVIIHVAGGVVEVGPHLRQRCGWCGAVLIDQDLRGIAVPVGQEGGYPTWPTGSLVGVDRDEVGGSSAMWVVEHKDGDKVPANCCAALDPAATA